MGQLIDTQHPIFQSFPTEYHTNWQWWPMASQRAFVLPHTIQAIVTEMDCYAYLRPMAQLFEARCGGGVILASSMGLQDLQQYPEARALLHSLYQYMDSESFAPSGNCPRSFSPAWPPDGLFYFLKRSARICGTPFSPMQKRPWPGAT